MMKKPKCPKCNSILTTLDRYPSQICLKCNIPTLSKTNLSSQLHLNASRIDNTKRYTLNSNDKAESELSLHQTDVFACEKFKKDYPEYIKDGKIVFPIEDSLFDEFETLLKPIDSNLETVKLEGLPSNFEYLLEIWNVLKTFPEYFEVCKKIEFISDVQLLLLNNENFTHLIRKILDIFIKDFTIDKNEPMKKSKHFDYFSILRFSVENGFLNKIYMRCWPNLALKIFNFFCGEKEIGENETVFKFLEQLSLNCVSNCPSDLTSRSKIISFLVRLLPECQEFRNLIGEKCDFEKKQVKKSIELDEKKKRIIKELAKMNEKEREAQKEEKYSLKHKESDKASSSSSKQIENNKSVEVELIRTQKTALLLKFDELENEILDFENKKLPLTCVESLGLDRKRRNFWVIFQNIENIFSCPDKIFISSSGNWSYLETEHFQALLKSLNPKGIREHNLQKSLNNYLNNENLQKMLLTNKKINFLENLQEDAISGEKAPKIETISIFEEIKSLLTENELRLTVYLEERNSRWGTEAEREKFLEFLERMPSMSIAEILEQMRNFNDKICVVETEYKRINQNSEEEIDIKTRKVQTKIWGISEKYKLHWTQFSLKCEDLSDVFFLIYTISLNIEKYTSKNRKKRKEFEIVKEVNKYIKTNSSRKDELDWEEVCEVCNEGGELLCCDICPKVFHLNCLSLPEYPWDKYQCEKCNKDRNIRELLRRSKT